jgi:hypothetical protein
LWRAVSLQVVLIPFPVLSLCRGLAWFDAGAFSTRCGGGFYPITNLAGCRAFGLNAFLFLDYFFAGQWRLDAGAFSRCGGGFYPITNLAGCRAFGLNAFLFLDYFFAGQGWLDAGAFASRDGGGFRPITSLAGCRASGLNAFFFLDYFLAGQGGGKNIPGIYNCYS